MMTPWYLFSNVTVGPRPTREANDRAVSPDDPEAYSIVPAARGRLRAIVQGYGAG
jgi:hypothetical protein